MTIKILGKAINFSITNAAESSLPRPSDEEKWVAWLTARGFSVDMKRAIKVSAVIRCVDLVAKTMASLPLNLFIEGENDSSKKAKTHNLYKLLYRLPNPRTTAYEFWHMYIFNLMLTKGGYAKIVRDRNGFIRQLKNIPTANVRSFTNKVSGEPYIIVSEDGKSERLREGDFMYTPGIRIESTADSLSAIEIASEVLGLTINLNKFADDYFKNGSNLGGFIEGENILSDQSYDRFRKTWQTAYEGVANQHKIGFLEGGLKFHKIVANPNDAQALESRKFAVIEICRIFGVPPHKVYELDRATFDNIEELNIEFVQEALTPMAVRLEQTIYKDLLTYKEQDFYYAKFNINGLMRGNITARSQYYHNLRNDGVMNADEIRALEDMGKIPEGQGGDAYLINGNMISIKHAEQNLPKSMQQGSNK